MLIKSRLGAVKGDLDFVAFELDQHQPVTGLHLGCRLRRGRRSDGAGGTRDHGILLCASRRRQRKPHLKGRSAALPRAARHYRSSMQLGDPLHQCESNAQSVSHALPLNMNKHLENLLKHVRSDADPRVRDTDDDMIAIALHRDGNVRPGGEYLALLLSSLENAWARRVISASTWKVSVGRSLCKCWRLLSTSVRLVSTATWITVSRSTVPGAIGADLACYARHPSDRRSNVPCA
jgi:hypothetical protein